MPSKKLSQPLFAALGGLTLAAGLLLALFHGASAKAGKPETGEVEITPSLRVVPGAVNGVRIVRGGKTLAVYGDPRENPPAADTVLFTHHRRDVAWAGRALVAGGARAVVPEKEAALFTGVRKFWEDFETRRFNDYSQQTTRILCEPLPVAQAVRGDGIFNWEGLSFHVLATPGYTRGAVSYLAEVDGHRIAFTGDLIYGDGRILDLYSLQDAIAETREDGYHGYAARAADVIASLRRIQAWQPDVLIPARGPVIRDPGRAIGNLIQRLQAVFASHFAIDALRWYRGDDRIRTEARRVLGDRPVAWMPQAETIQTTLPQWIIPIRNARLIVSDSGAGFMVDCGSRQILQQVLNLKSQGRIRSVEGLYITHYHNDHTDAAQAMAETCACPVYACREQQDILERPGAYRLPCLTGNPIRKVKAMADGATMRWHEFELTFSFFPGQTLYHGGLLVKKDGGETIFFIGDTFCPTGMDDYCLLNRNLFQPEKGYLDCLAVLHRMKPDYLLINQHVEPAFRYSAAQLDLMAGNFRNRKALVAAVVPWDDANYGVDEQWARFYPYASETRGGQPVEMKFIIVNHSPKERRYRVTPHLPEGWKMQKTAFELPLQARQEGAVKMTVMPPADWRGLAVITADIADDDAATPDLSEWAEALVRAK